MADKKTGLSAREKFNREKVDTILNSIKRLVSGRDTPIKQFVTNSGGSYSETKCKKFIDRLMELMNDYPLPEVLRNDFILSKYILMTKRAVCSRWLFFDATKYPASCIQGRVNNYAAISK